MPGEPPAEGCWDWTASLNDNGYGQFTANGIQFRAHVVSHSLYNTDDPVTDDRPYVLHSCDRPICVQPAHLRAGTPAENMADGVSRQRWPIGEGHYHAKLSETDVLSIRSCRGRVTETELARRFGVARTTIADVLHGRTWTHLVSPDRNEQMSKDNDERFCRAFHLNVDPQGNVSFRCEYCGETRTKVQPCPGPPERSATH